MNRKGHRISGIAVAITVWITGMVIGMFVPQLSFFPDGWWNHGTDLVAGVIFAFFGYMLPDTDQGYEYLHHRNWFTHSCLIPAILTVVTWFWIPVGFLSLVIGVHLLADLKFQDELRGFGAISKREGDRMSSRNSKAWLIGNAIACFTCCIMIFWVI